MRGACKVTYNAAYRRAAVYSSGCPFRCEWCSYRLGVGSNGPPAIGVQEVKDTLASLDIDRVHFVGGEPTVWEPLSEVALFARDALGARTKLGHTTLWNPPPQGIQEASVSLKTLDDDVHRRHTGVSNRRVLRNFRYAHAAGVVMDASSVLIPDLVGPGEVEAVARFVADVDPSIPFHLIAYVPVPDSPWRAPTEGEVADAVSLVGDHLGSVTWSQLTESDLAHLTVRDPRYASVQVA